MDAFSLEANMKAIFSHSSNPIPAGYAQAQPNSVRMAVRASFDGHKMCRPKPRTLPVKWKAVQNFGKTLKAYGTEVCIWKPPEKPSSIRRLSALCDFWLLQSPSKRQRRQDNELDGSNSKPKTILNSSFSDLHCHSCITDERPEADGPEKVEVRH